MTLLNSHTAEDDFVFPRLPDEGIPPSNDSLPEPPGTVTAELPLKEQHLWNWCLRVRNSRMLPADLQSTPARDTTHDIFLACSLGADLGLNRFQSLYGLYRMPNGQMTISTQCKRVIVAQNGGRFVEESFDEETGTARCVIEKDGVRSEGTFSVQDAVSYGKMVYNPSKKVYEGVTTRSGGDSVWKRDWRHMLAVRACSRACDKALAGTAGMLASTEEAWDSEPSRRIRLPAASGPRLSAPDLDRRGKDS